MKKHLKDFLKTILILVIFFVASLIIHKSFNNNDLITPLFVLGVFLVALTTKGYYYGIFAALVSVLAVNFAFTFPYLAFNFSVLENIISAIILISVTATTSTLVTQIKNHEKTKIETEKEKLRADLLRAISHDIRTPLTTIYGSASTVVENYSALSDESKIDVLNSIQKDSRFLIRMVENLLSITKLDSTSVELFKTPVAVEELIDSTLAKFKKNYSNQAVSLTLPEEFIMVSADPILIEQVLGNLLENAVVHAIGMTELKLKVYAGDTKVIFEVEDNGCGIEKEKLKNIFKGYNISDTSPADSQRKGMGIGLSVCAAIIKAHGGIIEAHNVRKGGTRFIFSLEREIVEDE